MIGHAFSAVFELVIYACPPWVSLGLVTIGLTTFGFYVDDGWLAITILSFAFLTAFLATLAWRHR